MNHEPSNVSDLMTAAADALERRDGQRLCQLQDAADQWLQTEVERRAQQRLLKAMTEAADILDCVNGNG